MSSGGTIAADDEEDVSNVETLRNATSTPKSTISSKASTIWHAALHHFARHAGTGVIASVAYFDPGNWSVDLQAGSQYGYKLLFVILLSGLGAVILQVLAYRLGCVTGLDLASHCRVLLHDHPRYPRLVRRLFLYPLYAFSEIAIISTDLAELLGSAIALSMLFPRLPLWAGVMVTSLDVLVILAITDKGGGRPIRVFESIIVILVFTVLICLVILIVKVKPDWPEVFEGYLPSKTLVNPGALYTAIGILGATVMPHALFLGSSLGTLDRITRGGPSLPHPPTAQVPVLRSIILYIRSNLYFRRGGQLDGPDRRARHEFRENNTLAFVKSHLRHGTVDNAMSLIGLAIPINSAILILAGTVFITDTSGVKASADMFAVHDLIGVRLGKPAAFMFALALLCAGQSASITATLAGQIVSEGFLEWQVSPLLRRLITRLVGLIPSAVVAATVGRAGIDTLLVASQVALAIILPFVVFPLVYLTSSHVVMRVKVPPTEHVSNANPGTEVDVSRKEEGQDIDYRNNKTVMSLGYLIFCLIVVANGYVLVTLMLGDP